MNRNLVLAVALSMLVYIGWYGYVDKRINPRPPIRPPATTGTRVSPGEGPPRAGAATQPQASIPSSQSPTAPDAAPSAEPLDRKTLEEASDRLTAGDAVLSIHPQGAAIVSCKYQGPLGLVELVDNPVPGLFATWPELRFAKQPAPAGTARYAAVRPDGVAVTKEFVWEGARALPRVLIRLSNETKRPLATGAWTLSVGPGLGTVPSEVKENDKVWRAIGLTPEGKGTRGRINAFKAGSQTTDYRWAGVDNRYFLAAVAAPQVFERIEASLPPMLRFVASSYQLNPGESRLWEAPFYLGPKANNSLVHFGVGLERSIDFGTFASIGRLILRLLGMIHGLTGNWGWAIILLTVVVQTVLFPLSYKTMKSAAAMKRLQPQIARLQQQYAKDPSRLNSEMMELYKRSGANPLGGCFPLLLQMPIFIALYNTLRNAWELHGAHWIFWVRDLSAKDPYYVLPVIMGGLMWLQNKFSPSAPSDPTQAMMMNWMPVIFTFMFLNFPSGLVLYWLTNSVISVSEQLALKGHFERAG
ncbi:MAG: membrane protein insertase YidC [Elusimicrobia bacterium]|nr:membrane protein insertase YidC [Elusimicrobiota bacterium]